MSEDEIIENKTDDLTVYGYKRNKFAGFGEYENDILKENEGRINELVEITKKEFPMMDNYLINEEWYLYARHIYQTNRPKFISEERKKCRPRKYK